MLLPDTGLYEGEYRDNMFHGKGTLSWREGSIYKGEFKHGLMHGKGVLKYSSGESYKGDFRNGEWNGRGLYISREGDQYQGEVKDSNFHGKGRYKSANGDIYEGDFVKGNATGKIKITYKDKSTYKGQIKNWKMSGKGVFISSNGTRYSGQFDNDAMNGIGIVKFANGGQYEGEIKNWRGNGKGKYLSKKGAVYEGDFVNGRYNGKGSITFKSGNKYTGEFRDGFRHGYGVYTLAKPKGRKKQQKGWWEYGEYIGAKKPSKKIAAKKSKRKRVDAEKIYYSQPALLSQALKKIKPSTPDKIDLYMVSFASYGYQNVFMNEAEFSKNLFDSRFGTNGRSLALINNHKKVKEVPLASVTNLERSLEYIADIMDKQQDILFLFLTSHGSSDHTLSVSLRGLPLNDLPAKKLSEIIKKTGIKWKVLVVSSCYSGGFINQLKDDYTLIMTASKSDHVSFGCSDEAEFTYFGRAFFKNSLANTPSFIAAFNMAAKLVSNWEDQEEYSHSEPQIFATEKIKNKLKNWRKTL